MVMLHTILWFTNSSLVSSQAYVQSFVCTDVDGDLLNQGLGDKADASVANMVSLI